MKLRSLGRLGLAASALICLYAVIAAPAFGAGKPINVKISFDGTSEASGPNHLYLTGFANPNGASTTLALEYRAIGATEWVTAGSKEIGSGSQEQSTSAQAFFVPRTAYELRASATNSYGTVASAITKGVGWTWSVRGNISTSAYVSSGTFMMEFEPSGGYHDRMECAESGSGEFGPEAKTQGLSITAYNCALYLNNDFVCNPKSFTFNLNAGYQASTIRKELCPGEEVLYPITFNQPFLVTSLRPLDWSIVRPATLTADGSVGGHPATFTISSSWQLSGANVGKEFTFREYEG